MDVCISTAPDKEVNQCKQSRKVYNTNILFILFFCKMPTDRPEWLGKVCKDFLTTKSQGSVHAANYDYGVRSCSFQIQPKTLSQNYLVTCNIGDRTNNPTNNWVAVCIKFRYASSL